MSSKKCKEDRKKIEKIYKELEEVRELIKIIYLSGDNKFLDSLDAEENRLLRFIENIKGLDSPSMN